MTATAPAPGPVTAVGRVTAAGRLLALGRTELTLLGRAKGTLFTALVTPVIVPLSLHSMVSQQNLKASGLSVGTVLLPAAVGVSLVFAVYSALVTTFVSRREELVLKRLRAGELRDPEILAGTALPAVCVGLLQSLVLITGCWVLLRPGPPRAPHLVVLGLLSGFVICAALAGVTAALSRTTESAQVMSMPLVVVSMIGSGITVPLEVLPDRLASVCELLPLTPVITLIRGGWTGALSGTGTLQALATALAWAALAVFAVRRWFRWEPRR
ncbi:ABC transporter permease [Streptomyces sp. NPDC002004]